MKKLISLFVSLVLVIGVYAQHNQSSVQSVFRPNAKIHNTNNYFSGKTVQTSTPAVRAAILNEGFEGTTFPPTGWTKANLNTNAAYQWKQNTTGGHSGTKSATVEYDPSLAQQNEVLTSPTLNLTTLATPTLNFWWSFSYYWGVSPNNNYDFRVKISTNGGTSWTTIWTEDSAGVFTSFTYYKQTINLAAYASCTTFKIQFQYEGHDGAALYLDDISVDNLPDNSIEFLDIWAALVQGSLYTPAEPIAYSGYSQIPYGQAFPVTMVADVKNSGGVGQPNIRLHLKELTSGHTGMSADYGILPSMMHDTLEVDTFHTISALGTHRLTMYASSDSIALTAYKDTFNVVVNPATNGLFSRDNNYYAGNAMWNSVATGSVNAYQMAHLYEITSNTFAKSITAVIGGGSKVGAPIKAILYRGWGQTKTIVAESDYHFIQSNEIASATGANPPSIEFFFNAACPVLYKDSVYFAAIQAFGGADTVLIAANSDIPQPNYAMYIFDTDNKWYYFTKGTDPSMIRLNTNLTDPTGIVEQQKNNATLFQNVPNPSNNSTRISYELTKSEKVTFDIYDLTGRKVLSLNEGNKAAGVHSVDVNLSTLSSGTYFYTLRTENFTKTKKMIVKK